MGARTFPHPPIATRERPPGSRAHAALTAGPPRSAPLAPPPGFVPAKEASRLRRG